MTNEELEAQVIALRIVVQLLFEKASPETKIELANRAAKVVEAGLHLPMTDSLLKRVEQLVLDIHQAGQGS